MNTTPDHPDFTALALGEHIHGTPAQVVIEALRTSVTARREAEDICATARQLSFVLKGQPPLRLDTARRQAILNADLAAVRARFAEEERAALTVVENASAPARAPRTWVYPTIAAAAVVGAAILVLQLIPGYTAPSQRSRPPVTEAGGNGVEPPEGNGKILVTPVAPRNRESAPPSRLRPPSPEVVNKLPVPITPPEKGVEFPAPPAPPAIVKDSPPALPPLPPAGSKPPASPGVQPKLDNGYRDFATPPPVKGRK